MAQPVLRIGSAQAAADAAAAVETPSDVRRFEALAAETAAGRAYLETAGWLVIRDRVMGDGRPPLGRPTSLDDLARLFRWSADGAFSEGMPTPEARGAYLHAAAEIEAYGRGARRVAPVSPAPAAARPVPVVPVNPKSYGLSFAEALMAAQSGQQVAREGWTTGSYVTAQAGYPQGIGINANTARATGMPEGSVAVFSPYLMRCSGPRKTPDRRRELPPSFSPWTPDQDDLFAADWHVLPKPGGSA